MFNSSSPLPSFRSLTTDTGRKDVSEYVQVLTFLMQFHITTKAKAKAKEIGFPVAEYDGMAELWFDSLEDWKEILADEEFAKFTSGIS